MAIWVGLDYTGHVEQIGTEGVCQRHTPATYWAWYELYPAPPVRTKVTIRPEDQLGATVVRLDTDRFRLTLINATTGAQFSTVQIAKGVGNTHGTIVAEEPSFSDMDLAGFDPIHFTRCAFNGKSIVGVRLISFDIESDGGSVETTTSEVAANGSDFTVTRR